jgi:hypothetical protein
MEYDAQARIRESARTFDIHSQESELEAATFVDDLTGDGDGDETPIDDANLPDAMRLANAVEIQRVSKSPVFQNIFAALKELHAECVAKSKDEKQTADFRSLNHTKGLGVEQSIGVFTTILEESEARLKTATPAERRAMGSEANQFISDLIAPATPIIAGPESPNEPPQPSRVPSASVQKNTKAAQAFLANGGK